MTMTETTERTAHELAGMADTASPDTPTSAGAEYLRRVESGAIEHWDELDEDQRGDEDYRSDEVHELADGLVPIYTHAIWSTFVDLAAYQEDVTDYCGPEDEMERRAMIALYMIAERLVRAVWDEMAEADEPERGECDEDEDGWCTGACITRPHAWNRGGRCTRTGCNVAGTGDPCNDGNCSGRD
jgi:hypothetical protein